MLGELAAKACATLAEQGVPEQEQRVVYSADLRYHGQGFEIPVAIDFDAFDGTGGGLAALRSAFDADHERLFSFVLDAEHELVTVRATAHGPRPQVAAPELERGDADPSPALRARHRIWVDGAEVEAGGYDRALLRAGNVVPGPAIITEMDSTTLVLPGHTATVHSSGSLLIRPVDTTTES
ncbi:hypothetical protein M3G91_14070 [Micromonospora chalcea]|uniref:hypothetical protein n=1 Tax=Micromonospora chalcea TaxID=1874 RepID=UPI0021A72E80|nr:hypothetical protein [Micromonospora chalcea]MCT2278748.1 hypothetical protein [Micromonospora chalcea]